MKIVKKDGSITNVNAEMLEKMINESAKTTSVPLMPSQVKKISAYVIGKADEYGKPIPIDKIQFMIKKCIQQITSKISKEQKTEKEVLSRKEMKIARKFANIYTSIYLREGPEAFAVRVKQDFEYKFVNNAISFVAQRLADINIAIKDGTLQEENREKRENEVLSVIEIVDDDTKLAS